MSTDSTEWSHGSSEVAPGVRLHYARAGVGEHTVVLLHGYPQTWHSWRHVAAPLVRAGYSVVCIDYRGAGSSSRPASGYDKWTMAGDVRVIVREILRVNEPISLVGHDIGSMVSLAYALRFRDDLSTLTLMEATLPGTDVYERLRVDMRHWHFFFHQALDVPEQLTAGRERTYLKLFYDGATFNPEAITLEDLSVYASHFEQPGAMRAGFELYRAFARDDRDNRAALVDAGRLTLPVLGVAGAANLFSDVNEEMLREVATNVQVAIVPDAGHYVQEENPAGLLDVLIPFIDDNARRKK